MQVNMSPYRLSMDCHMDASKSGAPGRTRTCDPRLRRPMLYPPELRAREASILASDRSRPDSPAQAIQRVPAARIALRRRGNQHFLRQIREHRVGVGRGFAQAPGDFADQRE